MLNAPLDPPLNAPDQWPQAWLLGQAAALAFFAFIGFEDLVNVAEEAKSPERNLPIAILVALLLAGLIYIVVVWISTAVVPPAELAAMQQQGARVLDVRLIEDFESDPVLVSDAMYQTPDDIQQWTAQMSPSDGPVVVYCVAGKWVSQKAANYLQDQGFEVYSLEGGIQGWKASGMETDGAAN